MKNLIHSFLIFAFTLSLSSSSFAQGSGGVGGYPSPFTVNNFNEDYWKDLSKSQQKEIIDLNAKMNKNIMVDTKKQEECLAYNDPDKLLTISEIYTLITTKNVIESLDNMNKSTACNTKKKKIDCLYSRRKQVQIQILASNPKFAEVLRHQDNSLTENTISEMVKFFKNISNEK